jgi:hypothetical protein
MSALGFAPIEVVLDDTDAGEDDDTCHLFCCCSPDIALCGEDIADEPIDESGEDDDCLRCVAIRYAVCILCGYAPDDADCACGEC